MAFVETVLNFKQKIHIEVRKKIMRTAKPNKNTKKILFYSLILILNDVKWSKCRGGRFTPKKDLLISLIVAIYW